jgi:tripartite-type tricarboxylate transporter receptor subunit TctC
MVEFTRRSVVTMLSAMAVVPTQAQLPWPPVTLVVPFPPGGSTDALARLLAAHAQQSLGTNIIVENRAGGMGSIGGAHVAHGRPDGSTFLVTFDSHATIPALVEPVPFDVDKDMEPILLVGTAPYVIAANPSRLFKTFADVVAAAKQKPGAVTYSSAGPGTIGHLAMVLLGKRSGVEMTHVPYKGAGPAINDTIGGHVDLIAASIAILLPQIKAGTLRPLMQTGLQRADALKDVPTAIESGFAGFDASAWWGIFAPKGTPPAIVGKASAVFTSALLEDAVSRQLRETQQINLTLDGPDKFRAFFARQVDVWGKVIRDNNIKAQSS